MREVLSLAAATLLLGLFGAGEARAGVAVDPVNINLSGSTTSATVTVTNQNTRRMRFQIEAMTWQQDEKGEMKLAPTTDVDFYPSFLVLEPNAKGKVRVGVSRHPATTERTYRVVLDELPDESKPADASSVQVLVRMSLPIFVSPSEPVSRVELRPAMNRGALGLEIKNRGNVHAVPMGITVRGLDERGAVIAEKGFSAWYVLAGGRRLYHAGLAKSDCARIRTLEAEIRLDGKPVEVRIPVAAGACR